MPAGTEAFLPIPTEEDEDAIVHELLDNFSFEQALHIVVASKWGAWERQSVESLRDEAERLIRSLLKDRREGQATTFISCGPLMVIWDQWGVQLLLNLERSGVMHNRPYNKFSYMCTLEEARKVLGTYMYLTCPSEHIRKMARLLDFPIYPNGWVHYRDRWSS